MSVRVDPQFLTEIKKYGAVNVEKCFNCGTCTATCPLSTDSETFPRRLIRYAQLGLKEKLSPKINWPVVSAAVFLLGIYGGFILMWAYLAILGRGRASGMPRASILFTLVCFVFIMGFDGINAFFYDTSFFQLPFELPHLYTPRLDLRLSTGLLCGIALRNRFQTLRRSKERQTNHHDQQYG
jgi:ferredoxin